LQLSFDAKGDIAMARFRTSPILCLIAFLWLAPVAVAQTAPNAHSQLSLETVTVLGTQDQEALAKIITRFVEVHSALDRKSGLLVREDAGGVCPLVMGLPQAYDDFVSARIDEVAKAAGSPVQGAGKCDVNVEVFFTNDAQGLADQLAEKTHGAILGYHFTHEKSALIHFSRPIQAWYVTGTRDDPKSLGTSVNTDSTTDSAHHGIRIDRAYGRGPYTGTGSRVRPNIASNIVNTLIIVDLNEVGGREIGPVADYISLLALSQPASLDDCNDFPSILDLMSSGCKGRTKPTALTDSDMAYLKALYAADITTSAASGEQHVTTGMTKELTGGSP
jgi:hypothetical protein